MDSISNTAATEAAEFLCNVANEYQRTVMDCGSTSPDSYPSSTEDDTSENPVQDVFYGTNGRGIIIYMHNFSSKDFKDVWSIHKGDVGKFGMLGED